MSDVFDTVFLTGVSTEEDARDALVGRPPIEAGVYAEVVRGRKVPKGTRGFVKVVKNGEFGRVALLQPLDGGDPYWLKASHLQVSWPGLKVGQEPLEGWLALHRRVEDNKLLPQKGDTVYDLNMQCRGVVNWVSPNSFRFGVQYPGATQMAWFSIMDPHIKRVLAGSVNAADPANHVEYSYYLPAIPKPRVNTPRWADVAALPGLFGEIRQFEPNPGKGDLWTARNDVGDFLCTLPFSSVQEICKRLED